MTTDASLYTPEWNTSMVSAPNSICEMLIARTRAVQSRAGAPNLRLSADLDRLVRRLETECRRLHVRYMNERKALQRICDYVSAREARLGRASAA